MAGKSDRLFFTAAQSAALLSWAAEGLRIEEVRMRARAFDPPFEVTKQNLQYVKQKAGKKYSETRDKWEKEALDDGLARKAVRIKRLTDLAEKMEADLFGERLWLTRQKQIGMGVNAEIIEEDHLNEAGIRQYRGILDDIAKELGHRQTKIEHSGKDGGPLTFMQIIQSANDPNDPTGKDG